MRHYRLVYKQPYEYDDDSPSGIGDHQVGYDPSTTTFEAKNDTSARETVKGFLEKGGCNFGSHSGSPPAGLYPRQFVSLVEFKQDRPVRFEQKREKVLRQ